ncbi:MAG: hypothetical protein QOH72_5349 [Solirubrobacteraceae bacterium]|nr:hypothetical protein [Solirubrobacteraceae bacterium]
MHAARDLRVDRVAHDALDQPRLARPDDNEVDVAIVRELGDGRGGVADRRHQLGGDVVLAEERPRVRHFLFVMRR